MIKTPSIQHEFDVAWSQDPAFDQSTPDYAQRFESARDLGDYKPIQLGDEPPTLFTVRRMPSELLRSTLDKQQAGDVGSSEACAIAFRACVSRVSNWPDLGFKLVAKQVAAETMDKLDAIAPGIVGEIGGFIWLRSLKGIDPKS